MEAARWLVARWVVKMCRRWRSGKERLQIVCRCGEGVVEGEERGELLGKGGSGV